MRTPNVATTVGSGAMPKIGARKRWKRRVHTPVAHNWHPVIVRGAIFRVSTKVEPQSVRRGVNASSWSAGQNGSDQMRKSETAWKTAARMAALAAEADNAEEREYYTRMRDAWITLANRCEFLDVPDVTEE
jgi:hypothetical protein